MSDPKFITMCNKLKTITLQTLAYVNAEATAKYLIVPSDENKDEMLHASSTMLLRQLLEQFTPYEIEEKLHFLELFNINKN